MKKNSANITLYGGFISFFSFALPWQGNYTGAHLANSGVATIITGTLICMFVIIAMSFSTLNKETSWNTVSKLFVLITSCVVLLIVIFFLDRSFTKYSVIILRLGLNIFILLFILLLFGIIVYITNRAVFLSYWKTILALFFGGGAILACMYIVPFIAEYGINFIVINFIGILTIIGISISRLFRAPPYKFFSNFLLILCSGIGLSIFLIMFFGSNLFLEIDGISLNIPQFGLFLMAIGSIIAIVGTLSHIKHVDVQKIQEEHNEITDS